MAKEKTICAALSVPDQSPMGWWSVGELCWLVVKAGRMFPFGSRLGISKMTVGKWRRRDLEQGIEGLREKERPGDPRTHDDERVAKVSNTALHSKPLQGTDWSVRTMARHRGISKSTVHRWFKMFGV